MKVGLNKACFGLNVNTVTQELSGKAEIHKHDCCASSCLTGRGGVKSASFQDKNTLSHTQTHLQSAQLQNKNTETHTQSHYTEMYNNCKGGEKWRRVFVQIEYNGKQF